MPNVTANGIQIEYDTFGDSSSPPLLLIMGFGLQMINWPDIFCEELAKHDLFVIRFDNRDAGLSSKFFEKTGSQKVMEMVAAMQKGKKIEPPYTLEDMAADAIGLLDALNLDKAHVCGWSMGGIIGQLLSIHYPTRMLSFIALGTSTGEPDLPPINSEAQAVLFGPHPPKREEFIQYFVELSKHLYGPISESDLQSVRDLGGLCFDRSYYSEGRFCHLLATVVAGRQKEALKSVAVPTQVIHGNQDTIFTLEHGKAVAKAIPNAELLVVEGMWHGPSPEFYPQVIESIVSFTRKVQK